MAEQNIPDEEPRIRKVRGSARRATYSVAPLEPVDEDGEPGPKQKSPGGQSSANRDAEPPQRAVENTDRAWGDSEDSNDERLKSDRPPHWG